MPDQRRLKIEKLLARAHQALYSAYQEAEPTEMEGLAEDCLQICAEVERIQTDLLQNSGRLRRATGGRA